MAQGQQFLPEDQKVDDVGEHERDDRAPAEVAEHERRGPFPDPRHHQHGRRGEVGERAPDRNVDEEQAERGVLQALARLQVVELAREQHGGDGHGRRFGDERPENRRDGQDRQPPRRRGLLAEAGDAAQRALGKDDDRARGRQRHDDDDEQRLGVVDGIVDVVRGRCPTLAGRDRNEEDHGPQPEDHFDLAEEVHHLGGDARSRLPALGAQPLVVHVLQLMRPAGEVRRREGVQDGEEENRRRHRVEGVDVDAIGERAEDVVLRGRIGRQRQGYCLGGLGLQTHRLIICAAAREPGTTAPSPRRAEVPRRACLHASSRRHVVTWRDRRRRVIKLRGEHA